MTDIGIMLRYRKELGWIDTFSLLSYCILPVYAMLIQVMVYGVTLLYLATTLSMMIIYLTIHVEQSRFLQKQQNELIQMRISIMLSQIQPHFLYNTLGGIQRLCKLDPPLAAEAAKELSLFLRGNMDSLTNDKPIPFQKELEHTQHYLMLEKMRFQNALCIEYDIQTMQFCLPTLTLQPIVENAVRYGVTKREEGGTVCISTRETEQAFLIIVEDNGVGFDVMTPKDDGRTHVGISNVRERLALMCDGRLEIESQENIGTKATIRIPKEKIKQ